MKRQLATWKLINKSLLNKIPAVLLYVVHSKGSSPGRGGFMLAINCLHEIEGSIGGGIMEHKFIELSKEILKSKNYATLIKRQIHDKSSVSDQSGMICSGEQTIIIHPVKSNEQPTIAQFIKVLEEPEIGNIILTPQGLSFSKEGTIDTGFVYEDENNWKYAAPLVLKNNLFIVGGGHCALAFSKIMSDLGFTISLFDNRQDLPTFIENRWVHKKTILNDYSEVGALISEGENNFIVIMTQGYRTDHQAIKSLWNKRFKYLGILGSANKIKKMWEQYRNEGVTEQILARLHAPIGIPINSETPEEIAISIAAEIIRVKNEKE